MNPDAYSCLDSRVYLFHDLNIGLFVSLEQGWIRNFDHSLPSAFLFFSFVSDQPTSFLLSPPLFLEMILIGLALFRYFVLGLRCKLDVEINVLQFTPSCSLLDLHNLKLYLLYPVIFFFFFNFCSTLLRNRAVLSNPGNENLFGLESRGYSVEHWFIGM